MTASPVPVAEVDEAIVTVEVRPDGVAILALDDRRDTHNTITPGLGAQLAHAIERVEQDASIAAAVLVSRKPDSFVVGANVLLLKSIKFASDAERLAREAAQAMRRIEGLRKPLVAAVHGATLGGGFELALACHAVVASDDPRTRLALPEVKLGLVPAANGLLRIADRAGVRAAIDLALTGRSLLPMEARHLRLVDDVCSPSILLDVAARRAKALVGHVPRVRDDRVDLFGLTLERNPVGRALLFRKARADVAALPRAHHPAAQRILDVLERLGARGTAAAAEVEAKAFGELVVSETAHRLIELFLATASLRKDPGVDEPVEVRTVDHVGVVGGGLTGSGVAYVTVGAGVPVRLAERDDAAAGRALQRVRDLLGARVEARAMTSLERDRVFARLSAATDLSGLRHAGMVVEAVYEDLALKQSLLRSVEAAVGPECIYASCTSSIPIGKIAQAARVPGRVLGMHYLSPVPRTPLLEVVRGDKTEPWAVAAAVALGKRQGKTVIVVRDGPGFYTTRVLAPLVLEAVQLASEGVSVEAIDRAMVDWGFRVGPLRLLDAVGIDVGAHVAQVLHAAFGDRMTPPRAMARLTADERKGRKNARGFYRYDAQGKDPNGGPSVDSEVYDLLGVRPSTRLPAEEIQMRCALAMVNEAVRCFGDGVLRSPRDGDVGAVLGFTFPSFRGGPFRYVDTLGAAEVLRRVQGYADRFGERWRPAPLLVQMAKRGDRFTVD